MSLQKNPFYLLKIPCTASRRQVVAAAEEMSFFLDASICSEAQNELINPNKRLGAELGWFVDADSVKCSAISDCISSGTRIQTEGLTSISKLNASLFNFSIDSNLSIIETGYLILDIDKQYSALDPEQIMRMVNNNRIKAGLASVQKQDIGAELNKKRVEIRQVISKKLASMDNSVYIKLITMLAEYISDADYNDGIILSDALDQYEIRMQSELEKRTEEIKAKVAHIKAQTNDVVIAKEIQTLIQDVQQWDVVAQPLQLKAQASGMPHRNSEKIGTEVREVAIFLNNERNNAKEAIEFLQVMRGVFSELENLNALFEKDSDELNEILSGEKDAKEIVAELTALKELSDKIKIYPVEVRIDEFLRRICNLDEHIKRLNIETKTKISLRESLCLLARGTAVDLHNEKHKTSYALKIAKTLTKQFIDLQSLKTKLIIDQATLERESNVLGNSSPCYRPANSSSSSGLESPGLFMLILLVFVAGICLLSGIFNLPGSASSSSTTTSSGSSYSRSSNSTVNTETKFSSISEAGDNVYADIVSIFPEIGIYTEGSSYYSYFVCKCKTTSGGTVWVYMTTSEYKDNFDSSASTGIYNEYADEVTYSSSKRVHGTARSAENVMHGLSADTGKMLIDYSY